MEPAQPSSLRLNPLRGARLDLLHHLGQSAVFRKAEEGMNMVAGASDFEGRRAMVVEDGGQIRVGLLP